MTADMAGPATGGAGMPNLENVIPATPQEVEEFLILNPVEEHAQLQFRQMDPKGQRMVIYHLLNSIALIVPRLS